MASTRQAFTEDALETYAHSVFGAKPSAAFRISWRQAHPSSEQATPGASEADHAARISRAGAGRLACTSRGGTWMPATKATGSVRLTCSTHSSRLTRVPVRQGASTSLAPSERTML